MSSRDTGIGASRGCLGSSSGRGSPRGGDKPSWSYDGYPSS
jgi:hypothetical protein